MDLYLTSLALGGVGLVAMAFSGFGRHGQNGGHSGGHSHAHTGTHGGTHAGAHVTSYAGSAPVAHGNATGGAHAASHASTQNVSTTAANAFIALMSPRVLFSVCLGLGTTGILLRNVLTEPLMFAAALAGGILFERLLVTPIWNFTFRFASNPALTLESALMGDATAVTRFDANGQGIIAIEVDGQMVQLLGTLQADDRAMGAKVLAGARLRVDAVDAARNRCTVSLY